MVQKRKGKAQGRVEINTDWCKGCGICVAFCPKEALRKDEQDKAFWARPEECNLCGICELRCPDMAIEVKQGESRKP
jgi:2-oxoglutarate ferredoxin oxidoreductase subunit delta